MREIIFRGKRVDNEEWVYGFLCCAIVIDEWTPHKWEDEEGYTGEYCTTESYEVIPETVGQYTGVIDKNGKKIFEGDIIDYTWDTLCGGKEHRTYVISYGNNQAKFIGDCVIGNPRHQLPTFECMGKRGEVIGNIYDNKEILEDKE